MSKWIVTSNQGFSPYAMEELRRIFTSIKFTQFVPGEIFMFEVEQEGDHVLQHMHEHETIFVRHIHSVDREFELVGDDKDIQPLLDMVSYIQSSLENKLISIHIRSSKNSSLTLSKSDIKEQLEVELHKIGAKLVLQQPDLIVSIYAHGTMMYVGFGTPEELKSDWPGGAIRFQREEGQVSRAKFKLLEAEKVFGLDFSMFQNAIDVGAAPGGWSSLLLERGLKVTAIDPANLNEQVANHPHLTHLQMNASAVKLPKQSFDLIVCDMSWNPIQMSKLVLSLKSALKPYSYGIITVKLMNKKAMQSIREVKERLSSGFTILQAKQLFHNREEITLFIQKKD